MKKQLVYETVYEEIKKRIECGEWKPGERIPTLEEISAELNVGISSVREAVRILGKQKILLVEQGRGTFVNRHLESSTDRYLQLLEQSSWMQLTEARLAVEPELAALAARNASEQDAETIAKCAASMANKVRQGRPFLEEDLAFHHLIASASGNEILMNMMRLITDELLDSRRRTMRIPGMDERAASYHLLIAGAIKRRDAHQARELMRLHILDMKEELAK